MFILKLLGIQIIRCLLVFFVDVDLKVLRLTRE